MKGVFDAVFRRFIRRNRLEVVFPDGDRRLYGAGGELAGIRIRTPRALRGLVLNAGLAFGEGYMDGEIAPEGCTLEQLLRVLMHDLEGQGHPLERVEAVARKAARRLHQFNTRKSSRRNVAHHYDLDTSFYRLFLDEDLQYSCAYFRTGAETLEEAQEAKKHHIAAKLLLDRPGLEVLDVGCGWGGLALYLAREHGARVTGITLSVEQHAIAQARAAEQGLSDRLRFELRDWRDVASNYDRVVSAGMFEHVGVTQFDAFFRRIHAVLRPKGVALLHSIGRADGPGTTNPWLDKYIFPGGYSPSLSETMAAIERSGLLVSDCEILRLHYARTIAHWRTRFAARRDEVLRLYDERFYRMFDLYLTGAELAFRIQNEMNFQVQLVRDTEAVPFTRDYLSGT